MVATPELVQLAEALDELDHRIEERPLDHVLWLPHQVDLLERFSPLCLLRTGNQLGKTWVGLAEVIYAATGWHPFRAPTTTAGEYWIICASWQQSLAIQKKLYGLLPKDRLHPGTVFTQARGFRAKNPFVEVRHEDGSYSIIRIKTTQQGALNLSGATIDGALFDEPPESFEIFDEVQKRVQMCGGWILLTLTPINAPTDWLRQLCEDGLIKDRHHRLSPEAMIPVGHDRPIWVRRKDGSRVPCDKRWVQEVIDNTSPNVVDVRCHGEWESRVKDAWFSGAFVRLHHVTSDVPDLDVDLQLGIDHGHKPGKQIGVLVCTWGPKHRAHVYVLDEWVDDEGAATHLEVGAGLLDMLESYGWGWGDLQAAHGDRVHMKGEQQQRSNRDLMVALGSELGTHPTLLRPQIATVKRGEGRGAGSVKIGLQWLFEAFVEGRLHIHPQCKRLIRSLERWRGPDVPVQRGTEEVDYVDPIDALRYALWEFIFAPQPRARVTVRIGA